MARLLVIGAVALDRPVWIDGPVRSGGRFRGRTLQGVLAPRLGGGAANAGCALRAAGHQVTVATALCDDADGRQALRLAEAAGLDLGLMRLRPGASPTTLILIDSHGERTILGLDGGLREPPEVAPPAARPAWRPDGLLIRGAYGGSAAWAEAAAGPVVLHWPAPAYAGPADVVVASADDLPEAAWSNPRAELAARLGPRLQWVVVSHGAGGAMAHGAGETLAAPARPAAVRDATGAGDVFAAGLLDALSGGAGMAAALAHACAWGAAAVQLDGSALVDPPPETFAAFGASAVSSGAS